MVRPRGTHILFLRVLSCPIKKLNTKGAKEYSLLIEEDGDNFMFKIIHLDDGFKIGKIATFNGFEWFKKTFNNLDDAEIYVQPAHLGNPENYLSYI